MRTSWVLRGLTVLVVSAAAIGGEVAAPSIGWVGLQFNTSSLPEGSLEFTTGEPGRSGTFLEVFADVIDAADLFAETGRLLPRGDLVLEGSFAIRTADRSITVSRPVLRVRTSPDGSATVLADAALDIDTPLLEIRDSKEHLDGFGGIYLFEAAEIRVTAALAEILNQPSLEGAVVGSILGKVTHPVAPADVQQAPQADDVDESGSVAGGNSGTVCPRQVGPDVMVGDLSYDNPANFVALNGIDAFSFGTYSCNIGNANLSWISTTNRHPVIGQNMFKLKNGRFEHIGQSWLKHGFLALTDNICGCGCSGQGGTVLGIGCADPYSSGLNGQQGILGPKWQVNAHTGVYSYPFQHGNQGSTGDSTYKRLQVALSDLELTSGQADAVQFFVEAQYVAPDDASSGNQNNNASYRRITIVTAPVNPPGGAFSAQNGIWTTQREKWGIQAWKAADPTVNESMIQIPGEGMMILASKVTDLQNGTWSYEYALENCNSDRASGSFSIPVPEAAVPQSIGFHDVAYHSGEMWDGTDWAATVAGGSITWATTPYATNLNANALRWATVYNFRFVANVPPQQTVATIGLFKPPPGSPPNTPPGSISVVTDGPGSDPDCQPNGIPDPCDLSCGSPGGVCDVPGCGLASDCDGNEIPDSCQSDCNLNTIADACEILSGSSGDCNMNGVPDDCEIFQETPLASALIASGFTQPTFATAPPGDTTRLFVVQQTGEIRIITLANNTVLGTPFLNISGIITFGGERGLLSMAFDPDYATNGFFYVNYNNTNPPGDTVIARYTVSGNPNVANPASAVILKTIDQDFQNHKGGQLQFGPDGMLYCGMGDGGSQNDPNNRAQDTGTLLGKMLRLDTDNPPTYIPSDNPFVGVGNPLDEIWALGMRNPWRFSFDRYTGDLYIGDVGQDNVEEIDFQPASGNGGENYGWRCMEGTTCTGNGGCICNSPSLTLPIHQYLHDVPGAPCFSLTGGYVYRGCRMPNLSGTYFYADYCLDRVWSFRYDGASVSDFQERTSELQTATGPITAISSFGEDADGEIYIASHDGRIYKIVPGGGNVNCGNGIQEAGEECDDGNILPGDGCSAACENENGTDNCDTAPLICPGSYGGSTTGNTADGSASCGISNKSPDTWYQYVPNADGTLTVSLCGASNYDTVLSLHVGCPGTEVNEVACDDDMCGNMQSQVILSVTQGVTYYIRISGYDMASGSFSLTLSGPNCMTCPEVLFEDHFDTDRGWTVQNVSLADGSWERGNPAGDGTRGDPLDDFDGGGLCYLTDNVIGNSDVDGGPTYLISPTLDLSEGTVSLSYAYWLTRDDAKGDDGLTVDVSINDGGSWTPLVTHDTSAAVWRTNGLLLDDFVTPTTTTRLRFGAKDNPNNTVVEAGVDAVVLSRPCFPDCNNNGINDLVDISAGGSLDCNGNQTPDECDINNGTSSDCDGGPIGLIDSGNAIVAGNCGFCHNADGSGGPGFPGPNLRNKTRVQIWNKLLPPTNHPGGAHPEFTQQDFANLEAFLADGGSRGRPDLIPDDCQSPADCDGSAPSDACELEAGTQVDMNYDGLPDDCVTPICNALTGAAVGSRYLRFSASAGTGRVAIRVLGNINDPNTSCLGLYVQSDGRLDTTPVLKTAAAWATIHVADEEIRPSSAYRAFGECTYASSALVDMMTWEWGNLDNQGIVDISDVLCCLDGFNGIFDDCSFESVNEAPCAPDGLVELADIMAILDAYADEEFTCPAPCPE